MCSATAKQSQSQHVFVHMEEHKSFCWTELKGPFSPSYLEWWLLEAFNRDTQAAFPCYLVLWSTLLLNLEVPFSVTACGPWICPIHSWKLSKPVFNTAILRQQISEVIYSLSQEALALVSPKIYCQSVLWSGPELFIVLSLGLPALNWKIAGDMG